MLWLQWQVRKYRSIIKLRDRITFWWVWNLILVLFLECYCILPGLDKTKTELTKNVSMIYKTLYINPYVRLILIWIPYETISLVILHRRQTLWKMSIDVYDIESCEFSTLRKIYIFKSALRFLKYRTLCVYFTFLIIRYIYRFNQKQMLASTAKNQTWRQDHYQLSLEAGNRNNSF